MSLTFHLSSDVCIQNNVLRRKKITVTFLYKSVEVHTSESAYEIVYEVLSMWNKWKCTSFLFYLIVGTPSIYLHTIFLLCSEKSNLKPKISTPVNQKRIKHSSKKKKKKKKINNEKFFAKAMANKSLVRLWLAYKIIDSNCCSQLFAEFIQTQKTYPTFLSKINCYIKSKFFLWT